MSPVTKHSLLSRLWVGLCSTLVCLIFFTAPALAEDPSVQIAWRLLDYIAVDYRGAVENGKIINKDEYAEMVEFAKSAHARIDGLQDNPAKAQLSKSAALLEAAIANKASADAIATTSRELAAQLVSAYPVPLAPKEIPQLELGKELYSQNCASCHASSGNGQGPAAAGLDPAPIDFTDKERAQDRSLFGLYQVITQGLDGTSMQSFQHLQESERWALAFYIGTFAYPLDEAQKEEAILRNDSKLSKALTIEKLVGTTPRDLAQEIGNDKADALTSYLRNNPAPLKKKQSESLNLARIRLTEALEAYKSSNNKKATDLALSAYLDGFEPVEPLLATKNRALLSEVESAMGSLRSKISKKAPYTSVQEQVGQLNELFDKVEEEIAPESTTELSSFLGAFAILLREGLEALLIVVAMMGFLRKAEKEEIIRYVHAGWILALVAGLATWLVATWLITISGATRELTEGIGSILAALVLLWVGIWMHGKSSAQAWQQYVRDNLNRALSRRSVWMFFGLSFLVVYREAFETIIFYVSISSQGNGVAVLLGALTAAITLVAIAVAMLHYSKILPIGKFFTYSSSLMAVLAVVLIGKGVAALQEAGMCSINQLSGFPRIDLLGMYPTMEGAACQAVMIALLFMGFMRNNRMLAQKAKE